MRKITEAFVHCSATPPTMDIGAKEIKDWHVNDNGWSDIGYHYIIRRDGTKELGRSLERAGAHVKGFNKDSIGICLVGGVDENGNPDANFTIDQYMELSLLKYDLDELFPGIEFKGHRDAPGVTKPCPCFDVKALLE